MSGQRAAAEAPGRIEDAFYKVIHILKDKYWPEFARVSYGLKLDDDVIDRIVEDFSKITKEQKYKLLKEWRRQNAGATAGTIKALVKRFIRKVSSLRNGSQVSAPNQQKHDLPGSSGGLPLAAQNIRGVAMQEDANNEEKSKKKTTRGRQVGLVGWDPNKGFDMEKVDPAIKDLFEHAGITKKHLQDWETAQFVYDFIKKQGGVEAIKSERDAPPPPPPSKGGRGGRPPSPTSRGGLPPPPPSHGHGALPPPPPIRRSSRLADMPPPSPPSNRSRGAPPPPQSHAPPPHPSNIPAPSSPPLPPQAGIPAPPPMLEVSKQNSS